MPKEYLDYIDKKFAEKKGIEELPNGKQYKRSVLEKYYQKGYLDGGKYDSLTLYDAGDTFRTAFEKKGGTGVKAMDPSKIRVDGGNKQADSEYISIWQAKYNKALNCIPYEFKDVVTNVCCLEIDIVEHLGSVRSRQYQKSILLALLRFGLARLVEHYGR